MDGDDDDEETNEMKWRKPPPKRKKRKFRHWDAPKKKYPRKQKLATVSRKEEKKVDSKQDVERSASLTPLNELEQDENEDEDAEGEMDLDEATSTRFTRAEKGKSRLLEVDDHAGTTMPDTVKQAILDYAAGSKSFGGTSAASPISIPSSPESSNAVPFPVLPKSLTEATRDTAPIPLPRLTPTPRQPIVQPYPSPAPTASTSPSTPARPSASTSGNTSGSSNAETVASLFPTRLQPHAAFLAFLGLLSPAHLWQCVTAVHIGRFINFLAKNCHESLNPTQRFSLKLALQAYCPIEGRPQGLTSWWPYLNAAGVHSMEQLHAVGIPKESIADYIKDLSNDEGLRKRFGQMLLAAEFALQVAIEDGWET